jgi:hypothetical protein
LKVGRPTPAENCHPHQPLEKQEQNLHSAPGKKEAVSVLKQLLYIFLRLFLTSP